MPTAATAPATPARPRPAIPGPRRIVVADDHPVYRDGIVRALLETGRYEIAGEAGDGLTTLELIRRQRPDVALVDLRMPRLDGLDLVRALGHEEDRVPLVLLSAFTEPRIVEQALDAGAAGYLAKDAAREEILAAIDAAALGGRIAQQSRPGTDGRPPGDASPPARREGAPAGVQPHTAAPADRLHTAGQPAWARALADSQRRAAVGRARAQQRRAAAPYHAVVLAWLRELDSG
jgi:DNA-binding NarL/FixJ family response regulator